MAGQPSRCGSVGAENVDRNHSATAGWNCDRGISNLPPSFYYIVPAGSSIGGYTGRCLLRSWPLADARGSDFSLPSRVFWEQARFERGSYMTTFDVQLFWLFVLSLPVACIAWTVTHEEVLREIRERCVDCSKHMP